MAKPDLPALLAHHAAAAPQAPWLFASVPRGDSGWRWWSWSQIADRVSRSATALVAEIGERSEARVGYRDRLDPEAVTAVLSILAAGAVPAGEEHSTKLAAWLGPDPPAAPLPTVPLREARSRLDRWSAAAPSILAAAPAAPPELRASPWTAVLAPPVIPASPKWHFWRFLTDRWRARQRSLVVASALLSPAERHTLLAAVLESGAAWALEPDPDAFVPAVLWTRPTAVVAPGAEIGLLALALGRGAARRSRRLGAVLITDDAPAEIVEEATWRELGVAILRLDEPSRD